MKKIIFTLLFAALLFSLSGCRSSQPEEVSQEELSFDQETVQLVKNMSLRQKIGQVLMVNFRYCAVKEHPASGLQPTDYENYDGTIVKVVPLTYVNETAKKAIQKYHIGNVILFAENLGNTDKALSMISQMQVISKNNRDLPLIISVDQEGGRVNRIFQTVTFPPAKTVGKTGKTKLAFTEGQYLAEQLGALGINLNFAPVCDVDSNPKNPVIGDRSFSSDPYVCGEFASQLQSGLKSKKIIPCAKHFPGHGDTDTDSHIGLPLVTKTKKEWMAVEAVPFKRVIKDKIPVIMTAHIQYPGLDDTKIKADKTGKNITRPATLSKKILTGILRNELQYEGVICTDAMDMKAISKNFSESQAVIEALNAGADLICNPISIIEKKDLIRLEALYSKIEQAVKDNTLPPERLDEAVMRIVQLKKDFGILDKSYSLSSDSDCTKAKSILSNPKYSSLKKEILQH